MQKSIEYLAILVILLLLNHSEARKNFDADKYYRDRSKECKDNILPPEGCKTVPAEFNVNCVNKCVSPLCFADLFSVRYLQPGEADSKRDKEFKSCVRNKYSLCKTRQDLDSKAVCQY